MSELPGVLPGILGSEGGGSEGLGSGVAITLPFNYIKGIFQGGASNVDLNTSRRWGGGKTSKSQIVAASGNTVLAAPVGTKRLTLYWIALETSEGNASEVLAKVSLGEQTPYTWYLGKPGAFMHWEPIVGEPGDELILNLSAAVSVAVNFTYAEGT